jgi:hypothetical protein
MMQHKSFDDLPALQPGGDGDANNGWMLGPFVKCDDVNPVLMARAQTRFHCPIAGAAPGGNRGYKKAAQSSMSYPVVRGQRM